MVTATRVIPASPVRDVAADVAFSVERVGADTAFGSRAFATLDPDGNPVTFVQWMQR